MPNRAIQLAVEEAQLTEGAVKTVRRLAKEFPGPAEVQVLVASGSQRRRIGLGLSLNPESPEVLAVLRSEFGPEAVSVVE